MEGDSFFGTHNGTKVLWLALRDQMSNLMQLFCEYGDDGWEIIDTPVQENMVSSEPPYTGSRWVTLSCLMK